MIYVIIGTRGQFIKMFPIMKLLDKARIEYKFVYTSQHYNFIGNTRKSLEIREPDIYLARKKSDLVNIWEVIIWALTVLWNGRKLSIKNNDSILIHGETETSILSLIVGKFYRCKIIHVEAGLRSGKLFDPFPEEIFRHIMDAFCDVHFSPYQEDAKNIGKKNNIYVTNGNTVFDSVRFAIKIPPSSLLKDITGKFVVFSLRRMETLYSKQNLSASIDILEEILQKGFPVIWPLYEVTRYYLKRKGLWYRIEKLKKNFSLRTTGYFDYVDYMHLIKRSEFVVSDGGGPQSETYYLNKPILLLRKTTENVPGMGETAYLSEINLEKSKYFISHYKEFKRKHEISVSPSRYIVNFLKNNSSKPEKSQKYEN
jgi:UDP-N-acetylglucosamine 2-epimerase (non-hydrolysing)